MQVFFFINGNDQHRIIRIQQSLSDFQPFLHERQPLAVTVFVGSVHVVVIIFPVPGAGVIRRIDIDAIHLTCVQVFQKLQCMVVVRFDQCVPQFAVRRITNFSQGLKAGVDGITQLCRCNEISNVEFYRLAAVLRQAQGFAFCNLQHGIGFVGFSVAHGHLEAFSDGNIIQGSTLRQMFLKHQTEFLLLCQSVGCCLNLRTQFRIFNFLYQLM